MAALVAARRVREAARVVATIARNGRTFDVKALALRNHFAASAMARAHAVRVIMEGELPPSPALLVANHRSYLDPIAIGALAPMIAVAKDDVRGWPLLGARLEQLGVIFVRRGDAASGAAALRRMRAALDAGANVLNFPEGTTSKFHAPLPFRRGGFGVALHARVPIVPVRIDYDDVQIAWVGSQRFLPHYVGVASRVEVVARVRVGAPLDAGPRDDAARLAERARRVLAELCDPFERSSVPCRR